MLLVAGVRAGAAAAAAAGVPGGGDGEIRWEGEIN